MPSPAGATLAGLRPTTAAPLLSYPIRMLLLAGIYFAVGKLSLSLTSVHPSASAFWPPTGISLAAFLILGQAAWPGIFAGAFLVNVTTANTPMAAALGIGIGNTLEGLIGALFVNRWAGGLRVFERPVDVFKYVLLAGLAAPMISATLGVSSLCLARSASWETAGPIWLTWWLGDAIGALVVAPCLVLWYQNPRWSWTVAELMELLGLVGAIVSAAVVVFGGLFPGVPLGFGHIPLLVWAAFRFGPRETATTALVLSGIALRGTLSQRGLLGHRPPHEALLLLQLFVGVITVSSLALAAAVQQQRRAEAAVRDQESRLELAGEAGRMGAWDWNMMTGTVTWSRGLEAIHGLAPGTFGGTLNDYLKDIHPADRDRVQQEIARTLAERREHLVEYRIVWPDGSLHWVEGRGQLVLDRAGQPIGLRGMCQDITARKRVEEDLQESERRFKQLAENIREVFYLTDGQLNRTLYISPGYEETWGRSCQSLYQSPLSFLEAVHPEDRPRVENSVQRQMRGERTEEEYRILRPDGSLRWIRDRGFPIRGSAGTVERIAGLAEDITTRKREEDQFRGFLEAAPDAMVIVRKNGQIARVNRQAEQLFGYRREELLDQPLEILVPERLRDQHAADRLAYFANPVVRPMSPGLSLFGRRKDGTEFPVEVSLSPLVTEEGLLVSSAIRDISERRHAEEARARLAAIVEGSEDAIFSKDLNGIIQTWNRGAEKVYGYSAAEAVGQHIGLLVPASQDGEIAGLMHLLRSGERVEHYETIRQRKDGRRIDVSLTLSPMHDASGNITAISVVAREITRRKRAERRLAAEHAVTRALAESGASSDTRSTILATIGQILGCDLGVFWEPDGEGGLHCSQVWHSPRIGVTEFEQFSDRLTLAVTESLPGEALMTLEPAWRAQADFPLSLAARTTEPYGALAVPLHCDGECLGVFEFFSSEFRRPAPDVRYLLHNACSQVSHFLLRRRAEEAVRRHENERSIARTIQQGLLPRTPPAVPGFQIGGASRPAREVGGDYFDFMPMRQGRLGVVVGDASSHGLGPALLIADTRAYLRAHATLRSDLGDLLTQTDRHLAHDMPEDRFVTLLVAALDPVTRQLVHSSAGHWPGYVFGAAGQVKAMLESTGLPLGVDPEHRFSTGPALALEPGDVVFLFTDGLVDASAPQGAPFGIARALDMVRAHQQATAQTIAETLVQAAIDHSGNNPERDDITVVIVKVDGP